MHMIISLTNIFPLPASKVMEKVILQWISSHPPLATSHHDRHITGDTCTPERAQETVLGIKLTM